MKPLNIVILAFGLSIAASAAFGSDIIDEVIKLQRAGIENEVMLRFVQDSNSSADLSADDIQKLEDVGVTSNVIVAMLDRSKELRDDPTKARGNAVDSPLVTQPHRMVTTDSPAPLDPRSFSANAGIVAPVDGQANISLFYEALAPYGTWSQENGNGWVWQPTDGARDPNWRPYTRDGHWTSTDQGWYWESTSPYGWAAFHYGRWGYSNDRWSWSPDTVWGPAWVDWRYSDNYIGWAPLPFGSRFEGEAGFSYQGRQMGFDFHGGMDERDYAFVSSNAFLNVDLGVSFVPEGRRHNVFNETKIINNTYVYNDNRVINNGVPTGVVSRATKRQIEQVKVVDANIAAGQPIRGEHRSANTIAAYRPNIAARASVEPPAIAERRKIAATHGTTAVTVPATEHRNAAPLETPASVSRVQRRDNTDSEKQSRQRLADEKAKRKSSPQAGIEVRQSEIKQPSVPIHSAVPPAAEERHSANQEVVRERKAEAVTTKEAQATIREESRTSPQPFQQHAVIDSNPAPQRTDTPPEARRAVNQEAATERKAAADTRKEAQREEREESKDEKAREKKDGQK